MAPLDQHSCPAGDAAPDLPCVAAGCDDPVVRYVARLVPGAPLVRAAVGLGLSAEPGRRWTHLIHSADRRRYGDALRDLSLGGMAEIEYRLLAADGPVWVRDRMWAGAGVLQGTVVDITRERQAEARAAEATAMMAAMAGSALDGMITVGEDGRVLEFNPEAERMFGQARDVAVGRPLADLILPEAGGAAWPTQMARCAQTGRPGRRMEMDARRRDGSDFPVELTIARTRLGDRFVFIVNIRDISDRRAAEAERDRSVRLLREAIENLPAGFTITGPDDRILLCNQAYAQAMGRPAAALVGRLRRELIARSLPLLRSVDGRPFDGSPEQAAELTQRLCRTEGGSVELEFHSGDTTIIGSSRLSDGSLVCVRTDVTEIRRAERAVRESAELLRQVLEACPVAIKMTRLDDGRILYQSPASRSLYGGDPGAPAYARDAFVDPADCDRLMARLAADGGVDGFEVAMRRGDGTPFPATIAARMVAVHGEPMVVGCTLDLTRCRALEAEMAQQREALHQGEKMAALGELLAGVAHELNNPLSVVVGQALLLKETVADPRMLDRLARLERSADRCVRIVKTFLAMARRRPKRSEPVCLNHVVREAIELSSHALCSSGVRLRSRLAGGLPAVVGDPDQLAQVMTNLIFNAEIAMREVAGERTLAISTAVLRHGGVSVSVRDSGPGVPGELLARVFEPFFTTRGVGVGTGIGLAFCHRVIESHGGRIMVENARGGGARFTIVLPAGAPADGGQGTLPTLPTSSGRRILVIDDEVDVADVVAAMLRRHGDQVEVALSGREAMTHLRRCSFDVVLSDLRMPGLDGEKLYDLLAAEHPQMLRRLGFITGDAMGSRAQRFLARSGRPVLEKPIASPDLMRLVADIADGAEKVGWAA